MYQKDLLAFAIALGATPATMNRAALESAFADLDVEQALAVQTVLQRADLLEGAVTGRYDTDTELGLLCAADYLAWMTEGAVAVQAHTPAEALGFLRDLASGRWSDTLQTDVEVAKI